MKNIAITIIAALFATNAIAVEIPERVQRKLLAAAPETDLDGDGTITAEVLKAGRDKLPEEIRAMLDSHLYTEGGTKKGSNPPNTKPHCRNHSGVTAPPRFIDPIFEYALAY
jgi:hypothetical protein